MLLSNKKALIAGATTSIGRAIAISFAQQGCDVAFIGTNEERAKLVLEELQRIGPLQKFCYFLCDVSETKKMESLIQELLATWGEIDILVNNAGITRDGLLMKMSEEDWDQVIDINLKSLYNTCRFLIRSMIKARKGKIINISSVVGLTGNGGQVNYAASKAGILGFTKALALEVASRGISVNAIAPGFIDTHMTAALTPEQRKVILDKIPMGHLGDPSQIGKVALFLASDGSDYMTGQVLTVDGGMVM